ncbi:TRAP transporter small permease subunit [Vibrio rarus]|uniref:TRAP transporter small permease subunit n=1 Tax=Vibrio rarus TaxID=413403 RepID=UPI0021C405AD|nr:TRAP transporter small permease [Vibrio rarus]
MSHFFIRLIRPMACVTNWVAVLANSIGTLVVLALVLVVDYDVIARGVFNRPFMGAVEVVQFSMVLIVFLQLPDVMRVNRLTRSDGFLLYLDKHHPKVAVTLRKVIDIISAILMALIAYAIWPEFLEMHETQDYFGVPGVFTAPWWPIKLIILLSSVLCVSVLLFKVVLGHDWHLSHKMGPSSKPHSSTNKSSEET